MFVLDLCIRVTMLSFASSNIMKKRVLVGTYDVRISRQIELSIKFGRWVFSFPPTIFTEMIDKAMGAWFHLRIQ